jgi:uncharacterized protein YecT (DUF1311 family)
VRVKGKGMATRLFEPIALTASLKPEQRAWIEAHERALAAYYAADWRAAEEQFAHNDRGLDESRYYVVMRNRIINLRARRELNFDGITNYNPEMSVGTY